MMVRWLRGFDMASSKTKSAIESRSGSPWPRCTTDAASAPRSVSHGAVSHRALSRALSRLAVFPIVASLATGSLTALAPSHAWAQAPGGPSAIARADAAFEEGREFFDQGRFKEACEKFELSMQLDPSPGTLLNLGNCYEPQGDLVRALETFERAFADAQRTTDLRRKELWTDAARERIASLSRRVPQLTLRGVPPNGRVALDRKPLERTSGALRINPGHHAVEVSAPGKRAFTRDFDIASGQRLAMNIPELEADVASGSEPAPAAPSAPARRTDESGGSRYAPWPYVLGGAGAVFLGAALATGLTANSRQNKLERECDSNDICPPSLETTRDSAETLALLTDVFWITGAVAAGVGVTLFVLDASRESSTSVQAGCFGAGCGILANGHF
jgi:hypothetical protein